MAVAPRNAPLNAEDDYCEQHGLFYEIYCPECSPREETDMARTRQKHVHRHVCDIKQCERHSSVFCSICGCCEACQNEGREAKKRRDRLKKERSQKKNTCEFCNKPAKKNTLGLCATHHCRFCKDCSYMGNCPECEVAEQNTHNHQHVTSTALVPVQKAVNTLHRKPNDFKECGCPYDGCSVVYCYDHDRYYCDNCTNGAFECPLCSYKNLVSEYAASLPPCECFEDGVRVKGITVRCEEHRVYFCKTCYGLCPICKNKAVNVKSRLIEAKPSSPIVVAPKHYPLIKCDRHGFYCSRCDHKCPDCNLNQVRWAMAHCDKHDAHYCPRCGLGCLKCGKKEMRFQEGHEEKEIMLDCPACKHQGIRDCPKHGFWCPECDGVCLKCEGCYTKNGVMHHKCSRPMSFCDTHKKYFCQACGGRCKLCPRLKYHQCGLPMSKCQQHDEFYCGKCEGCCLFCHTEERAAKANSKHHCGCNILYCARHKIHFCPNCDYLCKCALDCGVREKYYKPSYDDVGNIQNDIEWQWEDFQEWLATKKEFFDCLTDFDENWDELVKFMFAAFLMAPSDDPACEDAAEKFMCVDKVFKDLLVICQRLKAHEEPPEREDNWERPDEGGGVRGWEDEDGVMHYSYGDSCPVRVPTKIRVTVKEFKSDDLARPE